MGRKRKCEELKVDVREYIYELYMKEDVTISALAERFSIKPGTVSKIIKEERKKIYGSEDKS